jgi:pilus assembly protein Flp/PilA
MKTVIAPWVKARINAKSELGASLVEYALLVALIAVVCIVSIGILGGKANDKFSEVGSKIS